MLTVDSDVKEGLWCEGGTLMWRGTLMWTWDSDVKGGLLCEGELWCKGGALMCKRGCKVKSGFWWCKGGTLMWWELLCGGGALMCKGGLWYEGGGPLLYRALPGPHIAFYRKLQIEKERSFFFFYNIQLQYNLYNNCLLYYCVYYYYHAGFFWYILFIFFFIKVESESNENVTAEKPHRRNVSLVLVHRGRTGVSLGGGNCPGRVEWLMPVVWHSAQSWKCFPKNWRLKSERDTYREVSVRSWDNTTAVRAIYFIGKAFCLGNGHIENLSREYADRLEQVLPS